MSISEIKKEISLLDAEIAQLQAAIAKRSEEWKAEQQEMQADPMYRMAAADYIKKGDRSGLESWKQNRLMAEQSMVDKVGAIYSEKLEIDKAIANNTAKIAMYREKLATEGLGQEERRNIENAIIELENSTATLEAVRQNADYKLQYAADMYRKRTGKPFNMARIEKVAEKSEPSKKNAPAVKEPKEESSKPTVKDFEKMVSDWSTENFDKVITEDDRNKAVKDFKKKMDAAGISEKDQGEIIGKYFNVGRSTSSINKFEATKIGGRTFSEAVNALETTPTHNNKDVDEALNPFFESEEFKALQEIDQQELRNKAAALKKGTTQTRTAEGVQGSNVGNAVSWNQSKNEIVKNIEAVFSLLDAAKVDEAKKLASDIYSKVSGNPTAIKSLKDMGYEYSIARSLWKKGAK